MKKIYGGNGCFPRLPRLEPHDEAIILISMQYFFLIIIQRNIDQTEKDLKGAVNFLQDHSAVSSNAIGTVGFCMGGQLSLFAACANPSIGACVDFYGIHPNVQPDLKNLRAPVLGIFAENDEFVTMETAKGLESTLKEHGK